MLNIWIQAISGLALCSVVQAIDQNLPTVDLGYEIHQASSFDVSASKPTSSRVKRAKTHQSAGDFYNFSNIRFAEPPVGDRRFRAPVPPRGRSKTVNQGKIGRICPQADPAWLLIAAQFLPAYLTGKPFNASAAEAALAANSSLGPPQDPRTSEDCLFLDVIVPQKVFRHVGDAKNAAAPVLVWLYGGGFVEGEKTGFGKFNPAGLLNASRAAVSEEFVFVALNYRVSPVIRRGGRPCTNIYSAVGSLWMARRSRFTSGRDRECWTLRPAPRLAVDPAEDTFIWR